MVALCTPTALVLGLGIFLHSFLATGVTSPGEEG